MPITNRDQLQPGTRVVLPANPEEGWLEERGTVNEYDAEYDVVVITVDPEYRNTSIGDFVDDGLREVSEWMDLTLEAEHDA